MPTYEVELTDGRRLQVEADGPPNEADILGHLQQNPVMVNDRPGLQPDAEGFFGNEKPNATKLGLLETPLAVMEVGAAKLGNLLFDKAHGLPNMLLHAIGREGFPTEQYEFGSPEYAQGKKTAVPPLFEAGQPMVQGKFANEDIDPIERGVGNFLRGFTTPGSVATLGAGKVLKAPGVVAGLFAGPMLQNAPESTAQAAQAVGTLAGTPTEQQTQSMVDAAKEAILNEVLNKVFLGLMAQSGVEAWRNRPLTPEVLPAQPKPVAPTSRQLQSPAVDVESLPVGNRLPGLRGNFVVDEVGRVIDKDQLSPAEWTEFNRGPKVYQAPTKKTYQGDLPIIGEKAQSVWQQVQDAFNRGLQMEQDAKIVPAYQAAGEAKQGGQVSFASEAAAGSIPNARQVGLSSMAEALGKVDPEVMAKAIGNDAASLGRGEKMIGGKAQSSGAESKAPISEDGKAIANQLGLRYDGRQELIPGQPKDVYTKLDPENPFTVYMEPDSTVDQVRARMGEKSGSTKEQDQPVDILYKSDWKGVRYTGETQKVPNGKYKIEGTDFYVAAKSQLPKPLPKRRGVALELSDGRFLYSPTATYHGELVAALDHLKISDQDIKSSGFYDKGFYESGSDLQENLEGAKWEMANDPELGPTWRNKIGGKGSGSTKEQDQPIEDRGPQGGNLSSFGPLDPASYKDLVKAGSKALQKFTLATRSFDGRSLKNLVNLYIGRTPETAGKAMKERLFGATKMEDLYPQDLEQIYQRLSDGRAKLLEKGLSNEEAFQEIRARLFTLGARQGKNVVNASAAEMKEEQQRLLAQGDDVKISQQRRTQAVQDARAIGDLISDIKLKAIESKELVYYTGDVDAYGAVRAESHGPTFAGKSHRQFGYGEAGGRWRYIPKYNRVDWSATPSKDQMDAVDNWLSKRGVEPDKHMAYIGSSVYRTKTKGLNIKLGDQSEAGAISLGAIKDAVSAAAGPVRSAGQAVRWYSEPLVERLGRMGGPVSKAVSAEGGQIVSRQKGYYGELTPVVDPAKRAVGRPNPATTWMRKLHQYTDRAAVNNMFAQNEGTVPVNPAASKETALLTRANLAIGHMATRANPGFVPSNKLQRMLTSYGVDVVRRGAGPAWEAWTEGVAKANGVPVANVQTFFRRWKAELDEPSSDVASLNKINQDFVRVFPKSVTHIKPGVAWHEVLVADPFAYLEGAAQRTSSAVAFREVYPPGSSALQNTRKAVMKELRTDTQGQEFDNLIRALQGHPTDTFVSTWTAPDTWTGGGMRMLGQVVGTPLKSLMLSGNFTTNIGEVLVGGPAIFLGYKNALPAVMRLPFGYDQLELNGQVNRALQNYAYDPSSPVRSAMRALSGGIRTMTMQQLLNELQEAHAAMSASVVRQRIETGKVGNAEGEDLVASMRAMGMTEGQARLALSGNKELLDQFERRAASMLTSGHVSMAERSRAGTSRAFNELFWFHSYPQMALNQLRRVTENLAGDIGNRNARQAAANVKLLGRLIAGRTMQGAITAGIYALVFGGLFGLATKKKEAQDEFGKFIVDSFVGGIGGPAAIAKRLAEVGGDSKTLTANVAGLSTPVSAAGELYDLSMGNGKYEGRRSFERVGMFLEDKTPAWKMFKTGMALSGLAEGDPKLDAAKRAFYRWRRETMGWKTSTSEGDAAEDQAFRAQMRRVVDAMQHGGDWRTELQKVKDADKASRSLFARTLLRDKDGKGLSEEDTQKLSQHIGDEAVRLLKANDAMIRQVARELGEKEDMTQVSKPTGEFAADSMSQGKRIERIGKAMPKEVQDWLTKNELHLTDVSPQVHYGKQVKQLSNEEYLRVEEEAKVQYAEAVQRLMASPGFEQRTKKEKQARLNEVLTMAERRAKALVR